MVKISITQGFKDPAELSNALLDIAKSISNGGEEEGDLPTWFTYKTSDEEERLRIESEQLLSKIDDTVKKVLSLEEELAFKKEMLAVLVKNKYELRKAVDNLRGGPEDRSIIEEKIVERLKVKKLWRSIFIWSAIIVISAIIISKIYASISLP